jgi:hypothetical protein
MDAVEVSDHRIDLDLLGWLHYLCQRTGQGQVVQMIDVNRCQLGHLHHRRTPKETMLCCPESRCRHDIEGAGLTEVRFPFLATGPYRRIMILCGH